MIIMRAVVRVPLHRSPHQILGLPASTDANFAFEVINFGRGACNGVTQTIVVTRCASVIYHNEISFTDRRTIVSYTQSGNT